MLHHFLHSIHLSWRSGVRIANLLDLPCQIPSQITHNHVLQSPQPDRLLVAIFRKKRSYFVLLQGRCREHVGEVSRAERRSSVSFRPCFRALWGSIVIMPSRCAIRRTHGPPRCPWGQKTFLKYMNETNKVIDDFIQRILFVDHRARRWTVSVLMWNDVTDQPYTCAAGDAIPNACGFAGVQ